MFLAPYKIPSEEFSDVAILVVSWHQYDFTGLQCRLSYTTTPTTSTKLPQSASLSLSLKPAFCPYHSYSSITCWCGLFACLFVCLSVFLLPLSASISFHVNPLLVDFIIALLPDKIFSFTTYNNVLCFSSPPFENFPPPTLSHVSCLSDGFV